MRITNQMMQQTAKKTGIPLQQNTLLDILNKSSERTNISCRRMVLGFFLKQFFFRKRVPKERT